MGARFCCALAVVGLLLAAAPGFSHHAIQAQFDFKKPVQVKGVLTKVEWINPHSYFTVETMTGGKKETWAFESFGPGGMRKAGLSRRGFFKIGDVYTLDGFIAVSAPNTAWLKALTGPDGKVIQIWYGDPNPQ